jgi:hypothetical protein
MPFEWNNLIVVTKDELVPNWYSWNNLRTIIDRQKGKEYGIKRVQLGGNGRVMYIDFDTLPSHIQHGLGDPRLVKHVFEKYYKTDKEAVKFFKQYQFQDGSYLDTDYQDRYITNASVLTTVVLFRADIERDRRKKGQNNNGIDTVLCDHVRTFNKTLQVKHKDGHTLPESLKRFKQVLNEFESKGYKSLISGKHGNDNSRKVTDATLALLESMFATDTTKPTATEVHREYDAFIIGHKEVINNGTGEVYNPADFKKLSASTVKNYLAQWSSQIATHAIRSGDRQKYMQAFKPYHSLGKPKFSGSIISIDDRQPPFKAINGKRIWFYNAIDLASECFTCWVYGATKEGIILEFYRQLVRNYVEWGLCLPAELEAESSLNSSYADTFLQEGAMFDNVRIEANNARGKRIERIYGELRYRVEKKRDGWLARPHAMSESNQSGSHDVPMLPHDEIVEGCLQDIENWNNTPHSEHPHLTRWEVFMQKQHPDLKPINWKAFLVHLGYKTSTSCKVGFIKLQGNEYVLGENEKVCTGEKLIALMERVEGRDIDVYWLNGNDGNVLKALIYVGNLLICEAVPKPNYNRAKIEQTATDHESREIMSKYVATIEAYGKSRKRAIERVTIIDNSPTKPKTFIMPGLKQRPEQMDGFTSEQLPDAGEQLIIPKSSNTKTLKDRY